MAEHVENLEQISMEDIYEYIENLNFKSVALGGVDRDSVLAAIQEINLMFSEVYDDLLNQLSEMESKTEALRKKQVPLEKELAGLREEKETMTATIQRQVENSKKAAEAEGLFRQRETELREELDRLHQTLHARENEVIEMRKSHARELELAKAGAAENSETLEEIYLDARRSRAEMLQTAQEKAEALTQAAAESARELRTAAEQETAELRRAVSQEVERLRSSTEREADELRTAAEQETSALRRAAEEEAAQLREAAQQEAAQLRETARQEAEQVREAAQEQAARLVSETELAAQESALQCEKNKALAEQMVADAEEESGRILESARVAYVQERKKYDVMCLQLSNLRAKTVQSIRTDIAGLTELVFDMTGRGIETDALNAADINDSDDGILMDAGESAGELLEDIPSEEETAVDGDA